MNNKCPNCGFEYGEFDVFCSRCGYKIEDEQNVAQIKEAIEKNDSFEAFENENDIEEEEKNKDKDDKKDYSENRNSEFFSIEKSSILNNPIFNFFAYLIIIFMFMATVLFIIISAQAEKKDILQFKNYMNNPMQIPMLKEPSDYLELNKNFLEIEKFLSLYLKYSKDSQDVKEEIFANYLTQASKLPHITSENVYSGGLKECENIDAVIKTQSCVNKLNHVYNHTGIKAYNNYKTVYLYPDYKFIKNTYSKYLSQDFKDYLTLNAKYNKPVSFGLELKMRPKKLADKISDFEDLYNKTMNPYIKDSTSSTLYYDFRSFIFNPSIYATTTQEMSQEFKNAYIHYINTNKNSNLTPVIMSYLDKQRSYNEQNFKNDYPYQIFEENFDKSIQNSTFTDIFAQLRKDIAQGEIANFSFIYSFQTGRFEAYNKNKTLSDSDFVFTSPDENNNISIYTSTFSPFQQLNIQRNSKPYIISDGLYIYNKGRLTVSKLLFNGKIFTMQTLSASDVFSLFPGINTISLDNQQNYDIVIEKPNRNGTYIVLSKYLQGFEDYVLEPIQGNINFLVLPNMFSVNSDSDVIVSFHSSKINANETSDSTPTYKFFIRTKGNNQEPIDNGITNFDPQTAIEQTNSSDNQKANIMPKINQTPTENEDAIQLAPPSQSLEPPKEDD